MILRIFKNTGPGVIQNVKVSNTFFLTAENVIIYCEIILKLFTWSWLYLVVILGETVGWNFSTWGRFPQLYPYIFYYYYLITSIRKKNHFFYIFIFLFIFLSFPC